MLKTTSISLLLLFFVASCSSGPYKFTRVEKGTERKVAQATSVNSVKSKSDQHFKTIIAIIENKEIEKEILDTIAQIKKGDISQKDIDKIKINTKADFIFSLESSTEVASLYGSYLVRDNIKPLLNYEKTVDKLTKEDLINVAKKYLVKNNSTTVILKPEEK